MDRTFTLEYWDDDGWVIGRLKEVPGVASQGQTLADLEEQGHDLYINPTTGRKAAVPRHTEIKDTLAQVIKRQLGVS